MSVAYCLICSNRASNVLTSVGYHPPLARFFFFREPSSNEGIIRSLGVIELMIALNFFISFSELPLAQELPLNLGYQEDT